jgi:superfamily II DNA or RNA helicase
MMGEAQLPSSLRRHDWPRFVHGPDPAVLDKLYVPALGEAVRYDRCCAYFSSSVLAAAAGGFARLIARLESMGSDAPRPAVRLLVNEYLEKEDAQALMEQGDVERLERLLRKRFGVPGQQALERSRLQMLAWLVARGWLEVRVGIMRQGQGMLHAKFGIVTDAAGEGLVFSGSGNETAQALAGNYEQLEVSVSWKDQERHNWFTERFERLWADREADVHTIPLPEAIRKHLIQFAPKEPPRIEPGDALERQKAAMRWRFLVEAPFLSGGEAACDATAPVDLWPHQRCVVDEVAAAWPEGRLLCDVVGMGKTIEAILILRRLVAGRGVKRVLILLPAGLLEQWQSELREKGGLLFPRLEGLTRLVWPDGREDKVSGLPEALKQNRLLVSRELARTEQHMPEVLAAQPWDLVILDEAHAARRRKQVEGEFNSGTLLLDLLRQLQLRGQARGILLLSATPMQTQPWEPWDLLGVLGEGGAWLAEFDSVRQYYEGLQALARGKLSAEASRTAARLILSDGRYPPPPGDGVLMTDRARLANRLQYSPESQRLAIVDWLRRFSPLGQRMHRNTRATLEKYYAQGLLPTEPPQRRVDDVTFDFAEDAERQVYESITSYIDRRFRELEEQKGGKGFVMTVYRRRASSSPFALERSLVRRRDALKSVADHRVAETEVAPDEGPDQRTLDETDETGFTGRINLALPTDPEAARRELIDVESLLARLRDLGGRDSKRDRFYDELRRLTEDGRPVLVFSEYADTMNYLARELVAFYGEDVACYSGGGGRLYRENEWKAVSKRAITEALEKGAIRILVCTDAASEGLNLQTAGAVINYDLPWNPSKVEQRIGRVDRIGQRLPCVLVVNLFLENSVDARVYFALRRRCHLFEQFVGPMQPVLALARKMLLGQEPEDLEALDREAALAEQDALITETYREDTEAPAPPAAAPINRQGLLDALEALPEPFRVKRVKGGGVLRVSGPGLRKRGYSVETRALEEDSEVLPLSPLDDGLRAIADGLARSGERTPLVLGVAASGGFRRVVAYWIEASTSRPIATFDELQAAIAGWDGGPASADLWLQTSELAKREAEAAVAQMQARAVEKEQRGLARQVEAAKIRLTNELGRYLVCFGEGTGALDDLFYRQMKSDMQGASRLLECYGRLGGYPKWDGDTLRDLATFDDDLPEEKRQIRKAGSQLQAALEDPRWAAQDVLKGSLQHP